MKCHVTPELAILIKTLRSQNNISSKDLAEHVGRSRSYISKLEGGAIQTIQKQDLTEILKFVTAGTDFYEEKLVEIVRVLQSYMEPSRMDHQVWLLQYDCAERPIPVPEDLVRYFIDTLKEIRMTPSHLVRVVNANVDSELSDQVPSNEYLDLSYQRGSHMLVIRMQMTEKQFDEILDKAPSSSTYSVLFALTFTMEKLKSYSEDTPLTPDEARTVLRRTGNIMDLYHVHCLTDYSSLVNSTELLNGQENLYNSFKELDPGIVSNILYNFTELMDYDAESTSETLKIFSDNLSWDPAFLMRILRLPFSSLTDMSYSNKKKMLEEIQDIYARYRDLSDVERKIEEY